MSQRLKKNYNGRRTNRATNKHDWMVVSYLKSLLGYALALIAVILYAFRCGQDSVKENENERIVDGVKKKNKIARDVNAMSDDELDVELQKWKRPSK